VTNQGIGVTASPAGLSWRPKAPSGGRSRFSPHAVQSDVMPKRRRILKWTGAVGCVVVLGSWGLSTHRAVGYNHCDAKEMIIRSIVVRGGQVHYFRHSYRRAFPGFAPPWAPQRWVMESSPFELGLALPSDVPADTLRRVRVPLWLPFLIVALPTAFLLYRDRKRIPPGHCKTCGYNLTGAKHERCPECGEAE